MTVSKNPTSYKLSLEVENGVSAIGTLMSHAIVNVYVTEKAALDQAE